MTNDAKVCPCSGRLLVRALFVLSLLPGIVFGQSLPTKPITKQIAAHRINELTLAGLRPGKDRIEQAKKLYGTAMTSLAADNEGASFRGNCTGQLLRVDADRSGLIQQIIVTADPLPSGKTEQSISNCSGTEVSWPYKGLNTARVEFKWRTGRGVPLGANVGELTRNYGPPDSKSPSTRNGQPLELWYYAFDWAGENVPQVMEVLCTRETDGKPGQVVEITLAAPSL